MFFSLNRDDGTKPRFIEHTIGPVSLQPLVALLVWFALIWGMDQVNTWFWPLGLYASACVTILVGWSSSLCLLYVWVDEYGWWSVPVGVLAVLALMTFPALHRLGVKDALGLLGAFGVGRLLALLFQKPGYVVSILFVGACWDGLSFFAPSGPVRQMAEKAPRMLHYFSLQYPLFGRSGWIPVLGFADWLLIGLVMAICFREQLNPRRVFGGICGGMALLLVLTVILKPTPGLPALPFVALGSLYGLWEFLGRDWEGLYEGLGAGIAVTLVTLLLLAWTL